MSYEAVNRRCSYESGGRRAHKIETRSYKLVFMFKTGIKILELGVSRREKKIASCKQTPTKMLNGKPYETPDEEQ